MERIESRTTYYKVFLALIVLTVVTTAVAYVDLGRLSVVTALAIAVSKMLLVALFFMHVRHSSTLTKVVVSGGLLWLAVLVALSLNDYITRGLLGVPGK